MNNEKKNKRQCKICKAIKERKELIRLTRDYKDGEIKLNINNEYEGRSIYICKEKECLEKFIKNNKRKTTEISENINER